jgi:hypothetical protein
LRLFLDVRGDPATSSGFVGTNVGTIFAAEILYQHLEGAMPLTDAQIKAFRPSENGKPVKLADGQGLFLMVMPNGSKYWRYHYRFAGKQKTLALGVYPDITLKQARTKREDARRLLDQILTPAYKSRWISSMPVHPMRQHSN